MDIPTIVTAQLIILAVFSVTFISLAWNTYELSFCSRWASANLLLATSIILILLSSYLPRNASYLFVNVSLISGLIFLRNGAAEFHGVFLSRIRTYWSVALVTLVTLGINLGLAPSRSYMVFNLVAFTLCAETLYFYFSKRSDGLRSRWGLTFCYSLLSASFALRVVIGLADEFGLAPFIEESWLRSLYLGLILIFLSANGAFSLALVFERMAAEHKVAASKDALTGVFNRREFFARLNGLLRRRAPGQFAVVLFDLDHFKQINDQLGHSAGDLVLKLCTQAMQKPLQEKDCLARIGGEEFLIILPDTALSNSHELAERIRLTTANTTGNTVTPACTVSIGIAQLREGDTLQSLIQRADEALYQAKSNGRNCVAGAC